MNDDITVDLGEIDIDHAKTLLLCVENAVLAGLSYPTNYQNAVSLKALLTYRIAKAEQTATWAEPA